MLTLKTFKQKFAAVISHALMLASPNVMAVAVLVVLVEVCALSVVYTTYRNRVLCSELEGLRKQSEEMQAIWTQLLLDHSTLVSFQRVVEQAGRQLQMRIPDPAAVVVLEQGR